MDCRTYLGMKKNANRAIKCNVKVETLVGPGTMTGQVGDWGWVVLEDGSTLVSRIPVKRAAR